MLYNRKHINTTLNTTLISTWNIGDKLNRKELIQEIDRRNADTYKKVYKLEKTGLETAQYIEQTLSMTKDADYRQGRYQASIMLAANALSDGQYAHGFTILEQLDRVALINESTNFIKMMYFSSYMLYYIEYIGDEEKALEYAELELKAAEAHQDISEIMRVRMNMATMISDRGLWETARDMYVEISNYCNSVHDVHLLAYTYLNLAEVHYRIGDLDKAKATYAKALKAAIETEQLFIQHDIYIDLAKIHMDENKYDEAFDSLKFAENLEEQMGKIQEKVQRFQTLINFYTKLNRLDEAFNTVLTLESQLDALENVAIKAEFYKSKADLCHEMGRYDLAYEALTNYLVFVEQQNTNRLENNMSRLIHEDYNKKISMLDALASIGRELTILPDIDEMLLKLQDEFDQIISIDSIGIGLIHGHHLHFEHYFSGKEKITPKSVTLDSDVSLAVWSIRNKEAVVINNLKKEYVQYTSRIGLLSKPNEGLIQSVMFRPLIVGNEIIGVFTMQSYSLNAYSSVESRIHHIITDYLAIGVSNAKQKEALRKLSDQDPLTGLSNRRGFTDYFDYRLGQRSPQLTSISIIMLDLDYFKKINDSYGHLTGDHALGLVGAMLKDHEGEDIIAARLGGEEFALIIVNKTYDDVLSLAENIRQETEALLIITEKGHVSITTSVGLTYKEDTSSVKFNQLYFEADKALYQSKANGRNKVSIYKH